ncbi:ACT domain-containing protein ACR12-like isoform X2 [Punica granatum]|uniref:ACT domain-containing protein ACR n=2 Tax=Punica granatum TaxID=22663 RepID=A0A6P8CH10_PUNGR|nr:ACT domain-containing protein ACR12-like isoform X2 [Punica granatum]
MALRPLGKFPVLRYFRKETSPLERVKQSRKLVSVITRHCQPITTFLYKRITLSLSLFRTLPLLLHHITASHRERGDDELCDLVAMASMSAILSSSRALHRSPAAFGSASRLSPFLEPSRTLPLQFKFPELGITSPRKRAVICESTNDVNALHSASLSDYDADSVPMPVVHIDQDSDPNATIVQLSFGDRLGALIDTMKALKQLGLDVLKGTVTTEGPVKQTKFFITRLDTGRKVEEFDMLERIRLTIINNLLKYHPESSTQLAMGEAFGVMAPEKKLDVDIATHIHVKDDGPKRSLLYIETADRPGLLVEIIKMISDVNIDVESAEIDTEGLIAKDKFHVSYRGAAVNSSLSQLLVNSLRYYLRRPETDINSY